ncbi:hypothetical protein [Caballeronia catudaia]|uniref:hypothetical protein n=1 Tax=Caballeronia catudaia TaxID=1777136 RepID=UPI000772265B|nr:hypothetical protein [Caballeronia catudaia]
MTTLFDIVTSAFRENSRSAFPFRCHHETPSISLRRAAALVAVSLTLGGCGLFGCNGFATNGGGFGGCSVGTRF